jgi:glycosyltransferase involved in cell wall biosynthesis
MWICEEGGVPLKSKETSESNDGNRRHICMLLQGRYDTDARVKRDARTLARDFDLRVIHLCGEGEVPGSFRDGCVEIERFDLLTRRLPGSSLFLPLKFVEFGIRVAWRASRRRPDAYHAHDLPMVLPALLAAWFFRAPVVYDAHELYAEMGMHSPRSARFWRAIDRWVSHRVDRVIAVNQSRADIMVEELGSKPPFIVPNLPIQLAKGDLPAKEDSPLREFVRSRVSDPRPVLLYQGVLAPGRALDQVLEAMPKVQSPFVLVLLGHRTTYLDGLLEIVDARGLSDRVLYHPGVDSDHLSAYTVGADAGLVIYAKTPLNNFLCAPNKLFEYCMASVPVIGCDFPEVRRVLDELPVGETFDVDSPDSIAAAIDRLMGDPDRLRQAQEATAEVRERYHWGVAQRELERLYAGLFETFSNQTDFAESEVRSCVE